MIVREPRRVSGPLMMGLVAFPGVFSWFLLRRGYANSTRVSAFIYAGIMLALGIYRIALQTG